MPLARAFLAVPLVLLVLLGLAPPAVVAQANVNVEVPPGKPRAIRHRNLPQGTLFGARVTQRGTTLTAGGPEGG